MLPDTYVTTSTILEREKFQLALSQLEFFTILQSCLRDRCIGTRIDALIVLEACLFQVRSRPTEQKPLRETCFDVLTTLQTQELYHRFISLKGNCQAGAYLNGMELIVEMTVELMSVQRNISEGCYDWTDASVLMVYTKEMLLDELSKAYSWVTTSTSFLRYNLTV
jgi:hypothetical protein